MDLEETDSYISVQFSVSFCSCSSHSAVTVESSKHMGCLAVCNVHEETTGDVSVENWIDESLYQSY